MRNAGVFIVTVVVLAAIAGPWLVQFDPSAQELALRLEGPSTLHWFGLDELGRDILSRVLSGARVSLVVGLVELERHTRVLLLHAMHGVDESGLVVGVVMNATVDPCHEVELELDDVIGLHQSMHNAEQVVLEVGVGGVPDAEAGVVLDLRRCVTDRCACPVRMRSVCRRCAVELDRRHP